MATLETELKFEAPDGPLPPLPDGLVLVGAERTITLVATYWDSADRDLLDHGVTLRHRHASDGSEDGWTLKVPAATTSAGLARTEVSVAGAAGSPPAELIAVVRPVVEGDALSPVARLTSTRWIQAVGTRADSAAVEVTVDDVRVHLGDRDAPAFRELEVEAVGPDGAEVLGRFDAAWSSAGLRPSRSKLARALGRPTADARRAPDPAATTSELVSWWVAVGVRQLVDHELRVRVDPTDAEAVHQARVATRRLRSNLKAFRPLLDRAVTDPLRVDLRWLGNLLGEVRDAQVLRRRLTDLTADHDLASEGLDELDRLVAGELEVAVANLTSALGGDRHHGLVERLRAASLRPAVSSEVDPGAPARRAVKKVVTRRWKRLRRSIDRLDPDASDVVLHEARKEVKQLRYVLQAAKPLGVRAPGLVKALGRLQDDLGELHDAVACRAWIARRRPRLGIDASYLAGQLDQVSAAEAARQRAAWGSTWEAVRALRFEEAPPV